MALSRFERANYDWPTEVFRRFFDGDWNRAGWLRVEEVRDDDQLTIRAEVPGIDPAKDVEITVTGDRLRIQAERQERDESRAKTGYRSEFRYGSFSREVILPQGVKADEVTATYAGGILEVKVPLPKEPAERGAKVIPVAVS